jgi:hypothetical protein
VALTTRDDWFGALADKFGIRLGDYDATERDRLWERVIEAHRAWEARRDQQ